MSIRKTTPKRIQAIDEELSKRFIKLDPKGYFLIKIDSSKEELIVEHFSNDVDELGRALDPETGKPIACNEGGIRTPINIFRGRSAKEIGIKLTESKAPLPLSRLDHALYLGRELQKAELCLLHQERYIQD